MILLSNKLRLYIIFILLFLSGIIVADEKGIDSDLLSWIDKFQRIPGTYEYMLPFGWSKDGKFAFIKSFTQNDGRGAEVYEFYIIDAVTDQIVFLDSMIPMEESDYNSTWTHKLNSFYKEIESNKVIIPENDNSYSIMNFPLEYNNDTFTTRFDLVDSPQNTFSVNIARSDNKEKVCVNSSNSYSIIDGFISGYIMSPYEPRIVIIYGLKYYVRDWEGGQMTLEEISSHFTGANLRVGF